MTPLEGGVKPAGRDGRGDGDDHQAEDGHGRGQDKYVNDVQDYFVPQVITATESRERELLVEGSCLYTNAQVAPFQSSSSSFTR